MFTSLATHRGFSALTLVLVMGAAACCSRTPAPDFTPTTAKIVARHVQDALEVELGEPRDKEELQSYLASIRDSRTREDLKARWAANAHLAGKSPGFLDDAFRQAEADGDWPRGRAVAEQDYVQGVQDAIHAQLGGR
jgi:hypothetical protein